MDRTFIALDTETATLGGAPHLLELGAVRVEHGDAVDRFESLVRPDVPVDPGATEIHGIGTDDVRDSPPAAEVLERFTAWAGEDLLVAHNASFDARVLGFEYRRAGLVPPPGPFLDTLTLARRYLPDAPDHRLETLCQWLDLDGDVHHRALADAVACWQVLEECARRSGESSTALLTRCGAPLSIASAGPRVPRLAPRLRPLEHACDDRSRVTLAYGDDEGTFELPVAPRLLFTMQDRGYLEAECLKTGILKTYRLDKVRRVVPRGG